MRGARWLTVAVVLVLAGCGGSAGNSGSKGSGEGTLHQDEVREARIQREETATELRGKCSQVEEAEATLLNAATAASEKGARTGAFEAAVLDVEALRTKLGELGKITVVQQTIGLEKSRFFLLRVGRLLEALQTGNHTAASQYLSGYEQGIVDMAHHIEAACKTT